MGEVSGVAISDVMADELARVESSMVEHDGEYHSGRGASKGKEGRFE